MGIYAAWALGALLSLVVLVRFYLAAAAAARARASGCCGRCGSMPPATTPSTWPCGLRPAAADRRADASSPPTLSASFYIAWMIASLLFGVPQSLSTVLYAVGSGESQATCAPLPVQPRRLTALRGRRRSSSSSSPATPILELFGAATRARRRRRSRSSPSASSPRRSGPTSSPCAGSTGGSAGAAAGLGRRRCSRSPVALGALLGGLSGVAIGWSPAPRRGDRDGAGRLRALAPSR